MVLLTAGDSWTQGDSPAQNINWNAKKSLDWYDIIPNFGNNYINCDERILYKFYESEVWPKVLGRELGLKTFNAGRNGSSNREIILSVINSIDYLNSIGHKNIFVVVGFTSRYRSQFIVKENNSLLKIDNIYFNQISKPLFKEMHSIFLEDNFCLDVFFLQLFLNNLNIPHLFFNCFDGNNGLGDSIYYKYIQTSNWLHESLQPHFKEHISNVFGVDFKRDSKYFKKMHPTDVSHIEWGLYLSNHIKNKKII